MVGVIVADSVCVIRLNEAGALEVPILECSSEDVKSRGCFAKKIIHF